MTAALPAPDAPALDHLRDLESRGLYLDAYTHARPFAPLTEWQGTEALVLAGRLASRWGATALSNRLHVQAFRGDPGSDLALYYYALTVAHKHGSFEVLALLHRHRDRVLAEPVTRDPRNLQLLLARTLAQFRDFVAAEQILARVERGSAEDAWFWVEKSDVLRAQDRYEEALQAARNARRLRPWYVPAIHAEAHLLQLTRRDDESLAVLRAAFDQLQAASLGQVLAFAFEEGGQDRAMLQTLERVEQLLPMADRLDRQWLAARRFDATYRLGDLDTALRHARTAADTNSEYHRRVAAQLESNPTVCRRVHLDVPFVRQHYATCAPATLAALSTFWGRPADHHAIAAEICYDGTPDHVERTWAQRNGWIAREFRVDWETATALLDQGCPFALVTVGIGYAHLQACIGYDARIGTLLIRDPYQRNFSEWLGKEFFANSKSHGPRGLLLLPQDRAQLVADLVLPEEPLYDARHLLRCALARHDRPAAQEALDQLVALGPEHLLTLRAHYDLALYDGNPRMALDAVRKMRAQSPDDVNWQLEETRLLDVLGLTAEHRAAIQRWGQPRGACTGFRRQLAEQLMSDGASEQTAERVARAALRRTPQEASVLRGYANWLWSAREFERATEVYRLAACSADKTESYWTSYFTAARHVGQAEQALDLLRQRFRRWSGNSGEPARTLFISLDALDRVEDGFACLEEARRARPEDGALLVFMAEAHGRYGRITRAGELLEAARKLAPRVTWLRTAARLARWCQRHEEALGHWRELVELDPCEVDFHRGLVNVLSICRGRAAAHDHLAQACRQNPQSLALRQLRIEWLRGESAADALAGVDEMLAIDPRHAWSLREKALILLRLSRPDEALAAANLGLEVEPGASASWGIKGDVLRALHRTTEADEHYQRAIRLSVDADLWFDNLLSVRPDFAARKSAISFVREQLEQQIWLEHPVTTFRSVARGVLSPDELDEALAGLWRKYPHHWSVWSALSQHRAEMDRMDDALTLAREATQRFPLVPRLWVDLATVQEKRTAPADAMAALEKAIQINAAFGEASRKLSTACERAFDQARAEHVLRRAIAADPDDGYNYGFLADLLWRTGRREEAMTALEQAATLEPDYGWAWTKLHEWGGTLKQPNYATDLLRKLCESRPGETRWPIRLVRTRVGDRLQMEENLGLLDRAGQLAPRNFEIHDLRAELLAYAGRHDDAMAACRPAIYDGIMPHELEGRLAWVQNAAGNRDAAIATMTRIVGTHPDYGWGWARLTEWHWQDKNFTETAKAAEKWAWLAPHSAVPYGYLAEAHENAGRKADAEAALQRSLAVDPAYEFGASELLKRRLAKADYAAAEMLLRHFETHLSAGDFYIAKARYALARSDRKRLEECIREAAMASTPAGGELDAVGEFLVKAGWHENLGNALAPLLREARTVDSAGHWWARARGPRHVLMNLLQLARLRPTAAIEARACHQLCDEAVERRRPGQLRCLVWLKSRVLRSDPACWGQVGYAFVTLGKNRAATRWLRDWRSRAPAPEPWMLSNLALAHYGRGKPDRAVKVLDFALTLTRDHTFEKIANWRAFEHAIAMETDLARERHAQAVIDAKSAFHRTIHEATAALIAAAEGNGDDDAVAAAETRANDAFSRNPEADSDAALRNFRRRTQRWFARQRGRHFAVAKTYLPQLRLPTSGPRESPRISGFALWAAFMLLSGLLRTCSDLNTQ